MRVLHLLVSGGIGGIESLCKDIASFSEHNNTFCFVFSGGANTEQMKHDGAKVIELNAGNSRHFYKIISGIVRICKEQRIQVMVIHHSAPLFYIASRYVYWYLRIPYFIYIHSSIDNVLQGKMRRIRSKIFSFAARKTERIICISNYVKNGVDYSGSVVKTKIFDFYNELIC